MSLQLLVCGWFNTYKFTHKSQVIQNVFAQIAHIFIVERKDFTLIKLIQNANM